MTEIETARIEAVQELSQALFRAAGETLMRHGDDPQSEVLLAAALAMFIDKTDTMLRPGFKRRMIALLEIS
jgi:hypothetical protein